MFTDVTTGARGDLTSITRMARAMVTQYGMSKKLGPLTFGDKEELIFLGRQLSEQRNYSEEVAEQIDFEVRRLVDEAHQRALQICRDHLDKLKAIANQLLELETLDAEQFRAIFVEDEGSVAEGDTSAQGDSSAEGNASEEEDQDSPPRVVPPSTAPLPA
jgi:cell division protease FtsH